MLLDNLAATLNLNGATARTFSIINLNGKGLYIEGAILIKNFSNVKIDLDVGKFPLTVLGEHLKICDLCSGSLTITGDIFGYYDRSKIKF